MIIEPIGRHDADALARFFAILAGDGETRAFFHPHPLTEQYASFLAAGSRARRDRYHLARHRGLVVGYSMLRGWDEGYEVPSFGGVAHPALRGAGIGHALLRHAIAECVAAGAPALRLSVHKANARAIHVYRKFGFSFSERNAHEWLGSLDCRAAGRGDPAPWLSPT